jgi:hypothetical protein
MMIEVIRERWTVAPRDTVGLDSLEIDWRFPAPGPAAAGPMFDHKSIKPRLSPIMTACVRSVAPSLERMLLI